MSFASEIADGLAELREQLGQTVNYVRQKTGDRIAITGAVRTKPQARTADSQGRLIVHCDDDWLLATAQLHLSGTRFKPAHHDRIEEALGDDLLIWEVNPEPGSNNVFNWSDSGHTQFRIHVQLIRTIHGEALDLPDNTAPVILQTEGLKWVKRIQYAGNATQPLPSGTAIAAGDYVTLTVDHGDQRTITYFSGVDFNVTAGTTGSLDLSELEDLATGDWLHIVNHGKPNA